MKLTYKYLIVVPFFLVFGCSEDILDENPPQLLTNPSLYSDFDGFQTGINGLYALVREEYTGRVQTNNLLDLRPFTRSNQLRAEMFMSGTDIMIPNVQGPEFGLLHENYANNHNPFHNGIQRCWEWLYTSVLAANTVINRAESQTDVDWGANEVANRNFTLAEARAMRAWAYRHLTYGWGDVPLVITETTGSTFSTSQVRTPRNVVRQQIINDLRFAEQFIPVEPGIDSKMTKGAVQTLLAEMYLAINKPDSALIWADRCINTPEYELITERYGVRSGEPGVPFMDMFYSGNSKRSEGNTEALWVFEHEFGVEGGGGSILRRWTLNRYDQIQIGGISPFRFRVDRGGRGIARMQPTTFLFDLYEPGDDRYSDFAMKQFIIFKDETNGQNELPDRLPDGFNYGDTVFFDPDVVITQANKRTRPTYARPYTRKFESLRDEDGLTEAFQWNDIIYMRLADTYLLKAEAEMKLGNTGAAANTINILRSRSNASSISPGDVNIDFILDERARELYNEEPRRWTLLRTGKWLERVRLHNFNGGQTIAERDTLHPIPQVEINANFGSISQNPGFN